MIKANINGKFVLGLDRENVKRLTTGNPILVRLADVNGPNVEIFITFGETLADVKKELEAAVGRPITETPPATTVH